MNLREKLAYLAGIIKERCEVAIKFRETFAKRERNLSKETFDTRFSLYEQMKHLNTRGS